MGLPLAWGGLGQDRLLADRTHSAFKWRSLDLPHLWLLELVLDDE